MQFGKPTHQFTQKLALETPKNMNKLIILLLSSSLLLSCSSQKIEPQSSEPNKEQEILSYFAFSDILYSKFERMSIETANTDPQISSFIKNQLAYFNKDEYNKELLKLIEARLTKQEVDEIVDFMRSPQGRSVQNVFANITDPVITKRNFESLSSENKAALEFFIKSPAGAKLGELLNSEEFSAMNKNYGEILMCRHIADTNSAELQSLQQKQKCLNI